MKRNHTRLSAALLAGLLAAGTVQPVFAQPGDWRGRPNDSGERPPVQQPSRNDPAQYGNNRANQGRDIRNPGDGSQWNGREWVRPGSWQGRNHWEGQGRPPQGWERGRGPDAYPRGIGPQHAWRRGDRLPMEYRHRQYYVDNYQMHRLPPPPRGYGWVQVGADYALIALATGVISQLIYGN